MYYTLINLIEWYEFTIFNSIGPYLTDICGISLPSNTVYIVLMISFIGRPIGSFLFSKVKDKALSMKYTLILMGSSSFAISLINRSISGISLFVIFVGKFIQALALGGSYGVGYISTYNEESEKEKSRQYVNYNISKIQLGVFVGILLGHFTVSLLKVFGGNLDFIAKNFPKMGFTVFKITPIQPIFTTVLWRVPFIMSCILTILISRIKPPKVVIVKQNSRRISVRKLLKAFLYCLIEFAVFYTYLAFGSIQREIVYSNKSYQSILSLIQILLFIIFLPINSFIIDKIKQNSKYNIDRVTIGIVMVYLTLSSSLILSDNIIWIASTAFIIALCYASLIPLVISIFDKEDRFHYVGRVFSIGSIYGGVLPFLAAKISNLSILGFLLSLPTFIGMLI